MLQTPLFAFLLDPAFLFAPVLLPCWLLAVGLAVYILSCWTPSGIRLYRLLIPGRRFRAGLRGWERLPTPGRCIYHRPTEAKINAGIRRNFLRTARTREIAAVIWKVLCKKEAGGTAPARITRVRRFREWRNAVKHGEYFLIYRRVPLLAGGWAQTESHISSKCVLGLENFYCNRGWWTIEAIGHEFVHVAQEIREEALRKEWPAHHPPVSGLRMRLVHHIRDFGAGVRIEWEAHTKFRLWPYTFVITLTMFILTGWVWMWMCP